MRKKRRRAASKPKNNFGRLIFLAFAIFVIAAILKNLISPQLISLSKTKSLTQTPPSPTKHLTVETIQTETDKPIIARVAQTIENGFTKKKEYTIIVYGDSMIETMGVGMDYLQTALKARHPGVKFNLYNYGIGGQNVQAALDRFDAPFNHAGRSYPSVTEMHPDILILGSFAYNPFSPYDRNRHWITYITLLEKAKKAADAVYILAEIAPLKENFGKGTHGVNWPEEMTLTQAREITELLDNVVALGPTLNVPVINAYYATRVNGNYGSGRYTDGNDGIHPSVAGHIFMANLIANSLSL